MNKKEANYKIRQVIDLTGVSEFLLRGWEERYSAFNPIRTKTGRRLYSETDILRARAILALTQQGFRVGDIAQLSLAEMNQILNKNIVSHGSNDIAAEIQEIMLHASRFDWDKVRALVLFKKQKLKKLNWIYKIVLPILAETGRQVYIGKLTIAHEHIISAIIKESLSRNVYKTPLAKKGPRIVFAAPEGDFHDLGLLIANLIASELGANTLFLGAHMPKAELASVCVRYNATHLLLSSMTDRFSGTKDEYLKFLNFLDTNLNDKISIWLAGRNAIKYPISLKRSFKVFNSFDEFEKEVKACLK